MRLVERQVWLVLVNQSHHPGRATERQGHKEGGKSHERNAQNEKDRCKNPKAGTQSRLIHLNGKPNSIAQTFGFRRRQLFTREVHVSGYYSQKLSAVRLKQVYDIAPPRVRQYLDAEVNHVLEKMHPGDLVIELGCGYGRILPKLAEKAGWVRAWWM